MSTAAERDERAPHFVQSFARGLSVITAFGPGREALTLAEVARLTGMTRATARRFLLTMVDLGFVRFDGRLFRLTPRVLSLGYSYLSSLTLPGIAEPHLERLVGRTGESSSMSVLDGQEIVYVARVPTIRIMTVAINVGTRFPAHATSMGQVLLAHLPSDQLEDYLASAPLDRLTERTLDAPDRLRQRLAQVREQRYALADQELEEGLRSLAVPVHDAEGAVVAAVNVSSHASRMSTEQAVAEFLPLLLETVSAIEADQAAVSGR